MRKKQPAAARILPAESHKKRKPRKNDRFLCPRAKLLKIGKNPRAKLLNPRAKLLKIDPKKMPVRHSEIRPRGVS